MKKVSICLILICILCLVCSCSSKTAESEKVVMIESTVTRDMKFGSATVALSQSEIEQAGFCLGDSCDIEFGNGYKLEDVPFYNGYYVKNGAPVLVAYPGFPNISITLNNQGIWEQADLQENTSVVISLKSAGKYAPIQDSLGQVYSFERRAYKSDEQFTNFRALSGGKLKPDYLFRGASPVDNSRGRAPYTDALLKENHIGFVIDLADSQEDMERYLADDTFASPYIRSLYQNNWIILLDMGSNYQSESYRESVADGLKSMIANGEGPVFIHCMEGKDRTGFVCMLLEALAGADYEAMLKDYMITYENYYSVSADEEPEKYEAIAELYFNAFVEYLHGTSDVDILKMADYSADAAAYLRAGGMTDLQLQTLLDQITK